ncbi:hypothetical protein BKA62DRAFT_770024 [Auriculariales sp. MPI-PUGE-AT-0066]|nr:hypothetical protein BKA62DRAFT_770024 [Auriculariales sp. MPI-PUGE-AT-0066]
MDTMDAFHFNAWEQLVARCDQPTLKTLSLAAKQLQQLAQRELFRELHFTGWKFDEQITKRQKPAVRLVLARVVGLKSSTVHKYIQSVILKDWTQGHPHGDIWEIGEKLYDLISMLPNLRIVVASDVRLKSEHLQNLCGGLNRNIKHLSLRRCMFPFDDSLPYIIPHLVLEEPADLPPTGTAVDSLAYAAIGLISPANIRSLDLNLPTLLPSLLPQLLEKPSFEHLRSLRIVLRSDWPSQLTAFIRRCNVLKRLVINSKFALEDITEAELDKSMRRQITELVLEKIESKSS